jgi:hypothetical protein
MSITIMLQPNFVTQHLLAEHLGQSERMASVDKNLEYLLQPTGVESKCLLPQDLIYRVQRCFIVRKCLIFVYICIRSPLIPINNDRYTQLESMIPSVPEEDVRLKDNLKVPS